MKNQGTCEECHAAMQTVNRHVRQVSLQSATAPATPLRLPPPSRAGRAASCGGMNAQHA